MGVVHHQFNLHCKGEQEDIDEFWKEVYESVHMTIVESKEDIDEFLKEMDESIREEFRSDLPTSQKQTTMTIRNPVVITFLCTARIMWIIFIIALT